MPENYQSLFCRPSCLPASKKNIPQDYLTAIIQAYSEFRSINLTSPQGDVGVCTHVTQYRKDAPMKDNLNGFSCVGMAVGFIALLAVNAVVTGFILVRLWDWFVV